MPRDAGFWLRFGVEGGYRTIGKAGEVDEVVLRD